MASLRATIASLQVSRGLIAAAIEWACGVAITYAIGSLFGPLHGLGQGGGWSSLRPGELARLVLPAAGAAAPMAAAAFATYAPPGRYRLIETLGLIFLPAIPSEAFLLMSLPPLRGRGDDRLWLHPLELVVALMPAILFGGLLTLHRAHSGTAAIEPPSE